MENNDEMIPQCIKSHNNNNCTNNNIKIPWCQIWSFSNFKIRNYN